MIPYTIIPNLLFQNAFQFLFIQYFPLFQFHCILMLPFHFFFNNFLMFPSSLPSRTFSCSVIISFLYFLFVYLSLPFLYFLMFTFHFLFVFFLMLPYHILSLSFLFSFHILRITFLCFLFHFLSFPFSYF